MNRSDDTPATPPGDGAPDVTGILDALTAEERATIGGLVPALYDELRRLAEGYLRDERADHTLQATALVHEAYLRLAAGPAGGWNDRLHFIRVAAKTMRRILVNHAVHRKRLKRGGGRRPVRIDEVTAAMPECTVDLVTIDEALSRLAEVDPRLGTIVELHFFGGCTHEQVAEILSISSRTVEREWRTARAWLRKELAPAE